MARKTIEIRRRRWREVIFVRRSAESSSERDNWPRYDDAERASTVSAELVTGSGSGQTHCLAQAMGSEEKQVERHSLTGCGGSNTLAVSFNDARANRSSHPRFGGPRAGICELRACELRCSNHLRRRFFGKAYVSTACPAAAQETWVPRANEDQRWKESPCATPQKGTPQPHAGLTARRSPRVATNRLLMPARRFARKRICRANGGWCDGRNSKRCTGKDGDGRARRLWFFCGRTG